MTANHGPSLDYVLKQNRALQKEVARLRAEIDAMRERHTQELKRSYEQGAFGQHLAWLNWYFEGEEGEEPPSMDAPDAINPNEGGE